MIVTFCGHSSFKKSDEIERKILSFLEENISDSYAQMYLGGYGAFDDFACECCKKYKAEHPNVSLILVTPYINNSCVSTNYDFVIYPEIEKVPKRFAITYRNRYMIDRSDFVIAYVEHLWGGAYQSYKYAKSKGKKILNLANLND